MAHDLAERNPVADVRPSDILKTRKKRNYPRIDAKELPALLAAIEGYIGGEHTVLALKLMALTFVRTSELLAARWEEFDFDAARWNIPAERMKMRTPHIVPLSRQDDAMVWGLSGKHDYWQERCFWEVQPSGISAASMSHVPPTDFARWDRWDKTAKLKQ